MEGRTPTTDDDSVATDAAALRWLHRATREMVTHERPAAIGAVATDAAADVLGFALNSVRLHDEETDRLVLVAVADQTVEHASERRAYERGETVQWAALDDGEPKLYPDAAAIDDDGGGSVLVVPLCDAGVLTLGTTERDGIDQTDVGLARVLAASHLELTAPVELGDRDHLRAAREAVDRMERLTESILNLTSHRGLTDATESVAVGYVARSVWEDHAPAAATLDCASPPTVGADRQRLQTLFENLFDNAVGIGGPSVSVTIRDRAAGPGFDADDGPGFDADDGPGFDVDDPTELFAYGATVEAAGTGLGLALVRDIAEAHGWAADVDGEGGGTFVFRTAPDEATDDGESVDTGVKPRRHPTDT